MSRDQFRSKVLLPFPYQFDQSKLTPFRGPFRVFEFTGNSQDFHRKINRYLFSYFFTLGFVLFFHAFLLVAVVLETLKREKFARLSSAFCVTFCLFRLSSQSRPHNLHKIHGKMGKKLTLSRPWTTAPVLVCAETRVYSGHYIGHAMGRTAATRTT